MIDTLPGPATTRDVIRMARDLLNRDDPSTAGLWPRAAALLVRQAVEEAVDAYWVARKQPLISLPTQSQLVCLRMMGTSYRLASQLHETWGALSRACHHHPYELSPTIGELNGWIAVVEEFVDLKLRLLAYVRDQLGESPWTQIAAAIAEAADEDRSVEFTLPDVIEFAEARGFAWTDVHLVLEKLAQAPTPVFERVFVSLEANPPVVIPPEEVASRLRASLKDASNGRAQWVQWAKEVKVVWRRSSIAAGR